MNMKIVIRVVILLALIISLPFAIKFYSKRSIYHFVANDINGQEVKLSKYRGSVILIVNVASECGLTPQFLELQKIYNMYKNRGFNVLGFPSNSFNQEPRTLKEILKFCTDFYLVDFPIFEKIDVKGKNQSPLYKYLTEKSTNKKFPGPIRWNFEKFLIGKKGRILARFGPEKSPDDPEIIKSIEQALAQE